MVLLQIFVTNLIVSAEEINNVAVALKNGETVEKVITVSEDGEYQLLISFKELNDSTEKI